MAGIAVLTSAYYYEWYRPYIVGKRETNRVSPKRPLITEKKPKEVMLDQGLNFVLNKSLKNEIVSYARNVSHGVTGVRTAVKGLINNMEGFSYNAMQYGRDSALNMVENGLVNLTRAYNKSAGFMQGQQHSPQLQNFSYDIRERFLQNAERLTRLGVTFEDEAMRFDHEDFRNSTRGGNIYVAIGENIQMLDSVYNISGQVLTAPLSEHMQFRALNYHYNYQLGRMVEDGFGIIESGLIVDRIV